LNHLVTFLTEERTKGDSAIKDILLSSHPAFAAIKKAGKIPYRVVFHSVEELDALLGARSFVKDDMPFDDEVFEWDNVKAEYGIRVSKTIFDEDGKLKILTPEEWNEEWVGTYPCSRPKDLDSEIPF